MKDKVSHTEYQHFLVFPYLDVALSAVVTYM